VSAAQIAIAWVAAQGADIVPLIGARKRSQLSESLGALDVALSPSDLAAIEAAFPKGAAAGGRYAAAQLAHLDSER
jgi:aryl-alcohol dehydrogenase-like predicted oxidoreductase